MDGTGIQQHRYKDLQKDLNTLQKELDTLKDNKPNPKNDWLKKHNLEVRISDLKTQIRKLDKLVANKTKNNQNYNARWKRERPGTAARNEALLAELAVKADKGRNKAYNNEMKRFEKIDNATYQQISKNRKNRNNGLSVFSNANITRRAKQSANLMYRGVKPTLAPAFPSETSVSAENKRILFEQYGIEPLIPFLQETSTEYDTAVNKYGHLYPTNSQGGRRKTRRNRQRKTRRNRQRKTRNHKQRC